jgi:hypothetical protein
MSVEDDLSTVSKLILILELLSAQMSQPLLINHPKVLPQA